MDLKKKTAKAHTKAHISASGEQQVEPAMVAGIMEDEASAGDRLRSHRNEGLDSQVKKLEELITSPDWRGKAGHVISVCAGKSSVVRTIYYRCLEREAQEKMFDNYVWIVVPNPFDINEFCRRLLWVMTGGSRHAAGHAFDGNNIVRCQKELLSRRNLIIFIDGLQSEADWVYIKNRLKLLHCQKCCTVVVTREQRVAQHCADDQSLACNISDDQGELAPHPLQYQRRGSYDYFNNDYINYFMRPKGSSRLAKAYDWLRYNRLVGRDSGAEMKLEKLITSPDRRHHVISVCGIAGAGKSFVVRTIYSRCIQRQMLQDLFGDYAWVDVPHPFEITEFCRRLFLDWTEQSFQNKEGEDLVRICSSLLSNKQRRLVVIDGLRSTADWDSIQAHLRLATSTSCVVVVTRDTTVARHCATTEDAIFSFTSLREDETRRLIRDQIQIVHKVGPLEIFWLGEGIKEQTEKALAIMNMCGRSPEVLRALLSYYLVSKEGAAKIKADNFMKEVWANPDLGRLRTLFTEMHSNIHACPQVIKKCIFYLSIFHQGSSIRRDRLVRRWIAEGYSEGIDSMSMAVYTETKLFHNLAELGMITKPAAAQSSTGAMVNSSGKMTLSSCQVNSFFLEYITMRETEESIFLPLEVTVLDGGRSPPKTQQVGQHLVIRDWKGEKDVFDCLDLTRLRSLTVSGQWQPFFISDMMLVLRVLDLEGISCNLNDGHLKQIVEKLPRLKFLSLRGCKEITRLPRSVGDLRQLLALDVTGTSIVRLPGSIVKLQKLQYLRAGTTGDGEGGVRVPTGIGALKALHTLGAIDVSSSCTGVAILNKIHRLPQLRKLHVSGIKRQHNSLCVCVACFLPGGQASSGSSIRFPANSFGELKALEIASTPGMHVVFFQGAVPKLEKVKLYCHDGPSPQFYGLEFLTSSLKQILLKGPGCNGVKDALEELLAKIPENKIELTIAQGHGSQPEPGLAQGNQQMTETGPTDRVLSDGLRPLHQL